MDHNDAGNISSKRQCQGTKRGGPSGGISTESSGPKINSTGQSSSGTKFNISKRRKRNKSQSFLIEEFNKANPPTFDGEIKKGEEAKAWLFNLKNYFRVHNYSDNTKERIAMFNLNGGASIWWEHLKEIKRIKVIKLTSKQFERHFCKAYLPEKFYDDMIKEFYELNMGKLTLEAYAKRFMELLRYVPYLREEKEMI
jgi:hypothetical protein